MNNFEIFYDTKNIHLYYNGETFSFNLNDGDVGDYWYSFTTNDGVTRDVNFHQEDINTEPSFTVYDLDDDGYINTSIYETIECSNVFGNPENYFK